MSDIKIIWDNREVGTLDGDIEFVNGELTREEGLETAVWMSLFTDRRADVDDDIPDGTTNRKGWWGDLLSDVDDDEIGSRLWLLDRATTTDETLVDAEYYINEALEWMVEDGVVQEIEIEVERQDLPDKSATLAFKVILKQSDGTETALTFNDLWENQVS